ncbi:MAG: septum formation initiator family protein [Blautia sp.]|nr:septum formation initiator family protein [Blautia sp.]
MGKTKKKSKKKNIIGYNRLGMLAIALVVLILLGGLMIESRHLQGRLAVYDAKAATLEQAIEEEQERTKEIEELRDYMQTDEYAEEVARERLGLVKDNEIVFKEGQ